MEQWHAMRKWKSNHWFKRVVWWLLLWWLWFNVLVIFATPLFRGLCNNKLLMLPCRTKGCATRLKCNIKSLELLSSYFLLVCSLTWVENLLDAWQLRYCLYSVVSRNTCFAEKVLWSKLPLKFANLKEV